MALQDVWFFLWGLLWAVYFMTDGFDLGMGCLLPFLAKDDEQKRAIYSAMGPLWDGNEVWLITSGRRYLCRLSNRLRSHVQLALFRLDAPPFRADRKGRLNRVSRSC
jgi:hypothetical protein